MCDLLNPVKYGITISVGMIASYVIVIPTIIVSAIMHGGGEKISEI